MWTRWLASHEFRHPYGWLIPEVPPPVAVAADSVGTLRVQHEAQGLRLHARRRVRAGRANASTWAGHRRLASFGSAAIRQCDRTDIERTDPPTIASEVVPPHVEIGRAS